MGDGGENREGDRKSEMSCLNSELSYRSNRFIKSVWYASRLRKYKRDLIIIMIGEKAVVNVDSVELFEA